MAIDLDRFIQLRPYVYHVTAAGNLASIRRTGVLEPAASLMQSAGRSDLLRWRRAQEVTLTRNGDTIQLRDQAALVEENIALRGGWSFADYIEYLNEHVYFWPGAASGPAKSGLLADAELTLGRAAMLRAPTADLIQANPGSEPLFCQFNSGAVRGERSRRTPRGPRLFSSAADFPHSEREVVELAYRSAVRLPETLELVTDSVIRTR